jgi:low temperature requirement protein LtrA
LRNAYPFGLAAAAIAFADAIAYVTIINRQGTLNDWGRVVVIAALIVLAGVLATLGSLVTGGRRPALLCRRQSSCSCLASWGFSRSACRY